MVRTHPGAIVFASFSFFFLSSFFCFVCRVWSRCCPPLLAPSILWPRSSAPHRLDLHATKSALSGPFFRIWTRPHATISASRTTSLSSFKSKSKSKSSLKGRWWLQLVRCLAVSKTVGNSVDLMETRRKTKRRKMTIKRSLWSRCKTCERRSEASLFAASSILHRFLAPRIQCARSGPGGRGRDRLLIFLIVSLPSSGRKSETPRLRSRQTSATFCSMRSVLQTRLTPSLSAPPSSNLLPI